MPDPNKKSRRILLSGEVPSPIDPPAGCKFHPRCPHVMPKCKEQRPELIGIGDRQKVACYLFSSD